MTVESWREEGVTDVLLKKHENNNTSLIAGGRGRGMNKGEGTKSGRTQ